MDTLSSGSRYNRAENYYVLQNIQVRYARTLGRPCKFYQANYRGR